MDTFNKWWEIADVEAAPQSLGASDMRMNLNRVSKAAKEDPKTKFPNLMAEVGKLSNEARAELDSLIRMVMGQNVSWGTTTQKRLRTAV